MGKTVAIGGLAVPLLLVVAVGVVVLCCGAGFALYGYVNSVRDTGVELEAQLTAQYLDNQNYLSEYVSGFYEQTGVAQAATDALDQVLLDAVKGRYDHQDARGNPTGQIDAGMLFNAVVEAYPEAGVAENQALWSKILDYIAAKREGYRAQQSKLLDELRAYDTWRYKGLVRNQVVRLLGFPSQRLEARVAGNIWRGEDARDKMYVIVLTSDAIDAYETGVMEPLSIGE